MRAAYRAAFWGAWLVLPPVPVAAHHSPTVHYDLSRMVEIEGQVTAIAWRNPHVQITVEAADGQGVVRHWEAEYLAPSFLVRQGVTSDLIHPGDRIRMAGYVGRTNTAALFTTNILLASGREIFDFQVSEPRWTEDTVGVTFAEYQTARLQGAPEAITSSLFRVWSTDVAFINPDRTFWKDSYPLTDRARAAQASWDRVGDNPYMRCENGMPAIMDQFYPTEIVSQGDTISVYLEEQDVVRTIHMTDVPAPVQGSPYGHSVGHWEGDTLVVETTHINWPWFDQTGIPQTEGVHVLERFMPSEDGRRLDYTATVTDPAVFTEPVVLSRYWVWIPGEAVEPYNCVVSEERY